MLGPWGSWGVMKQNFDVALKVGRSVARQVAEAEPSHVASECPLRQPYHGRRVPQKIKCNSPIPVHPIELVARAYGLV